jgi:hypothetical protein
MPGRFFRFDARQADFPNGTELWYVTAALIDDARPDLRAIRELVRPHVEVCRALLGPAFGNIP